DPAFKIAVVGLKQEGPYAPGGARAGDGRLAILPMLSDGRLRALYGQARAVIVPSLLEGFGLYAAEALFEGAPLALSNRGAHPEVGGEAALYFDPLDREDFLEKVRAALTPETAARLKANAARQAEKFRWRAAARRVIDLYLCSP
ncbi:MAG: glycosyltransferase, partial [Hyphomonadaceae bacterium]